MEPFVFAFNWSGEEGPTVYVIPARDGAGGLGEGEVLVLVRLSRRVGRRGATLPSLGGWVRGWVGGGVRGGCQSIELVKLRRFAVLKGEYTPILENTCPGGLSAPQLSLALLQSLSSPYI